jgi:hypothetical protein
LALIRSKADVESQRDVIRERRFEHGFGSKLVLLEAGDFLRCELARTVGEVVNERDLHDVLPQERAAKGDRVPSPVRPGVSFRSSSLKRTSCRRHPRTDACCGVMNAMLGPTLRDVLAVAHRNETIGDRTGELLASNGETQKSTFTGRELHRLVTHTELKWSLSGA